MAKKPLKFGSRKRFAEGGSDKYKAKYDRKVADIESDYEKAKARKTGRAAEVAKAKYEQRMADAKDDLAKWTKSDRTQTRAAESAAERNLSLTRRYGSAEPKFDDKPLGQARPSDAELTKLTSDASQKFKDSGSFKAAFAAARKDPSKPKTFTWRGTSYTTELASEKKAAPARRSPPASTNTPAPASKQVTKPQQTTNKGNAKPDMATAFSKAPPKPQGSSSPWAKDSKGNWVNPGQVGTRMGDVLTLGLTAAARNNPSSGRNAYSAMSDYYKNKAKREAEAKAKTGKEVTAAVASGEKYRVPKGLAAKKGGSVKGYAKGGSVRSVDGIAKRGKTRAPMKRK